MKNAHTTTEKELLAALADLLDECHGKLGRNPYDVPAFENALIAMARAIGYQYEGEGVPRSAWMNTLDEYRAQVAFLLHLRVFWTGR